MNAKIIAIIAIFINNIRICQSRRYDNYSLINVVPTELDHIQFLQNLDHQKYIDVIFWKKPYKLFESVQVVVNPGDKELFIERAAHYKLKNEILMSNIQSAFDEQLVRSYYKLRPESFTWDTYHSLEDIYQWLADVATKYHNIVELKSIGKSAEGREIFAVTVKTKSSKFRAIVESGIHGNEWISVEFVTFLLSQLISTKVTKNWKLSALVKKYEWHLIPILNPDGYVYSQKMDRLWRKNRRAIGTSVGVDLNRNFDHSFGKFGTSKIEHDDYYCGEHPFSEPESQTLVDFIAQKKKYLRFFFSFHGYGQKIIIPFADRINHIDNYGEAENFGKQAVVKMYKMYGAKYSVGTIYDTMGHRISGNSASYVKKTFNVRYVYTFLLRDNGTYGYALPPEQILPTCKETLAGLIELMTAKHRKVKLQLFSNRGYHQRGTAFLIMFCIVFIL